MAHIVQGPPWAASNSWQQVRLMLRKAICSVTCISTHQAASFWLCRQKRVRSNPSPAHLSMEKLWMPYHPLVQWYQIAFTTSPVFHCSFSSLKDDNRLKVLVKNWCNFTQIKLLRLIWILGSRSNFEDSFQKESCRIQTRWWERIMNVCTISDIRMM